MLWSGAKILGRMEEEAAAGTIFICYMYTKRATTIIELNSLGLFVSAKRDMSGILLNCDYTRGM